MPVFRAPAGHTPPKTRTPTVIARQSEWESALKQP